MDVKAGLKTSELWVNVVAMVLSLLTVYGVLSQQQAAAWEAVAVALAPAIVASVYTWSRTRVKEAAAKNGSAS